MTQSSTPRPPKSCCGEEPKMSQGMTLYFTKSKELAKKLCQKTSSGDSSARSQLLNSLEVTRHEWYCRCHQCGTEVGPHRDQQQALEEWNNTD